MDIVVVGTGYVGLVTAACFAEKGNNVVCLDIDEDKIEKLNGGQCTIYEQGLDELLKKNRSKIKFTTDYRNIYKDAKIIVIAVGTPEREDGSANLDFIFRVCKEIGENLCNDCMIIVKSTVPIGTNDEIENVLNEEVEGKNIKINVISNPEFLSQGTAVKNTLCASRIVLGVENKESENKMKKLYENFNIPLVIVSRRSAEMIKYASNDFLALKISFINEIANFCEIVGADIKEVTKGMSYDERIGNKFLNAGLGYGGSCFPKDTKALHWLANDNGYEIKTIKAAIEVNENQRYKLFRKAKEVFKTFKNKNVAILGVTFKPNTDDLREAVSIPNIRRLLEEGANLSIYDPVASSKVKKIFGDKIKYTDTIIEAIKGADMTFIFTEWNEIKEFPFELYQKYMKCTYIFDGRGCYSINSPVDKIYYYSIGRKLIS